MKKTKVYLVPHTHWDREWYFTKDTGDVLLNNMMSDIIHNFNGTPMMLDGQFSLIDDYLKSNPESKGFIKELLKNKSISSGPFYTQPDVFNSTAETTFRNIEMGIKVGENLGVKNLKTAYLPDTFGFNQNLPQIFKSKGLDNFVFWRGISEELYKKTSLFKWEGVDGSSVNAYNFKSGYFSIGSYYPYNGEKSGEKHDMKRLVEKIENKLEEVHLTNGPLLLPLGGDQAPYMHEANSIIKEMNKITNNFVFEAISNFDQFFKEQIQPTVNYKGDLKIPFTGKIHRTISSSRYDIKNAFRKSEKKLYYLLEPLEIFYSKFDDHYSFASFKDENIIKPLLLAQAHDSLGGCNTDVTNQNVLHRLKKVQDFTISQVDLLIKKIIQEKDIPNENFVVFNPAPFKNVLFERKIVFSDKNKDIFYFEDNNSSLYTLSSENISLNPKKEIWKQDILIYKNNLNSISLDYRNYESNKDKEFFQVNKQEFLKIKDEKLIFFINKNKIEFKFSAIENTGDNYDFSPGINLDILQSHKINNIIKLQNNIYFIEMNSELIINGISSKVEWNIFSDIVSKKIRTSFIVKNKFINTRISIDVDNKDDAKIFKSQHLAITRFAKNDYIDNWKEKYVEYPACVDQNDGLINIGNWNIMTTGNNEIFHDKKILKIILYRSNDMVTKNNMKWRPSTSGLSFKWKTESSKLLKNLEFELEFNINDKVEAMNEWNFKPYLYKVQSRNFIANKMSKFVINNILSKRDVEVDILISKKILISSIRKENNDIRLRVSNPENKTMKFDWIINKNKEEITIEPYKIKEVNLKGAYDEK